MQSDRSLVTDTEHRIVIQTHVVMTRDLKAGTDIRKSLEYSLK